MPYVVDGPDGPYWTSKNGRSFGLLNGVGPAGQKYEKGKHRRADLMADTGLYADGKKGIQRISEALLPNSQFALITASILIMYREEREPNSS